MSDVSSRVPIPRQTTVRSDPNGQRPRRSRVCKVERTPVAKCEAREIFTDGQHTHVRRTCSAWFQKYGRGLTNDERTFRICGFGARDLRSNLPGDAGYEPDEPAQ